uniref:Centromere protein M n=1 Tax=Parascaris univalens TaxID=6257 RepID=A0A914ZXG6_PARUN
MHTSSSSSSSVPKPSFDPGDIVNGTWKVRKELGCGGCGIVYEVELIRGAQAGLRAAMKAETIDASHKYSETPSAEVRLRRKNTECAKHQSTRDKRVPRSLRSLGPYFFDLLRGTAVRFRTLPS